MSSILKTTLAEKTKSDLPKYDYLEDYVDDDNIFVIRNKEESRNRRNDRLCVVVKVVTFVSLLAIASIFSIWYWNWKKEALENKNSYIFELEEIIRQKQIKLDEYKVRESREKCNIQPEVGPCRALITKYYYNKLEETCKKFNYGGCDGNTNSYETFEECMKTCAPSKKVSENKCHLKVQQGNCRALIERFYFDSEKGKCSQFFYGGCGGNANNFKTLEDCQTECPSKPKENTKNICSLEANQGPCKNFSKRFYFNKEACHEFNYGGCEGNTNNFKTLKECQSFCGENNENNMSIDPPEPVV